MSFSHRLFIASALAGHERRHHGARPSDAESLASPSGQIILGAAVIDDVIGVLILAVASALVVEGGISGKSIALSSAQDGRVCGVLPPTRAEPFR